MIRRALFVPVLMGGQSYEQKVLGLNPIAYWPMTEASGTTAANPVNAAMNGTYNQNISVNGTAAGPIAGTTAPVFDGTNLQLDVYTATFASAMNYTEFTYSYWAYSTVWETTTQGYMFQMGADGSNYFTIFKTSTAQQVFFRTVSGGTIDTIADSDAKTNGVWYHFAMSLSKTNDRMRIYINGSKIGADATGIGVWSGAFVAGDTRIGVVGAAAKWTGGIAQFSVFGSELSGTDIASLATK